MNPKTNFIILGRILKYMKNVNLFGPETTPNALEEINVLTLIFMIRKGIKSNLFDEFTGQSPFSMHEWSGFLHL